MVGAWRTAGQEETGTATTRESHSGPAGEGSTTLWGPAARSATASDKSVLELGRRHMVPSQMLHHGGLWLDNAWCEDGGGSPVGHASLSNNSEAHPIRHEWSFSSQVGIRLWRPHGRAFRHGGSFIQCHLLQENKSSFKLRIAMGQSCSEAFRSNVWTALALFITLTRAELLNWEVSSCLKATCIGLG